MDGELNNASVTSRGWGVEMALPWSLLSHAAGRPCPPGPGDQWRINFSRVQYKVSWDSATQQYVKDPPDQREQNWVWSPQWQVAMHLPEFWGYVQFSQLGVQAAAAGSSSGPAAPTDAQFRLDPSWPLRTFLVDGYNLQKGLWQREGRYSNCMMELQLPAPQPEVAERPLVQCTETGFLISAQLPLPDTREDGRRHVRRFYINEEGRITSRNLWVDPDPPAPGSDGRRQAGWGTVLIISSMVAVAGAAAAALAWRSNSTVPRASALSMLRSLRLGRSWAAVTALAKRRTASAGVSQGDAGPRHAEHTEMEEQPLLLSVPLQPTSSPAASGNV